MIGPTVDLIAHCLPAWPAIAGKELEVRARLEPLDAVVGLVQLLAVLAPRCDD
jgi:hypothetical protein